MMKHLALALTLAVGLTAMSCAGPQTPSASPSAKTERNAGDEDRAAEQDTQTPDLSADSSESAARDSTESSSGDKDSSGNVEQQDEAGAGECRQSSTGLVLSIDRKTVSLEDGRLRAKMDGPICSIVMRITRKDGLPTVEKRFRYTGPERELSWNPVPRDQIEKIEVRITSKNNGFQAVTLIPWTVRIEHKEVEFDTDKAVIRPSEVASLDDSLAKIKEVLAKVKGEGLGTITLFIAGHTDTQGSAEHNLILSRNRARSIAAWFMKRGLCIPIAFEGFGETALKKMTADNVAEQANRRVDYILAVEPPTIRKGVAPAWKWISKGC
jgi:outer membrane protein OmpA-like peptidoglycan-associated protein